MTTIFPVQITPTWQTPTVCLIYRLGPESFLTLGLRDMDPVAVCLSPPQGFTEPQSAYEAVHEFALRTNTQSPLAMNAKELATFCHVYRLQPSLILGAVFRLSQYQRNNPRKVREAYELTVF